MMRRLFTATPRAWQPQSRFVSSSRPLQAIFSAKSSTLDVVSETKRLHNDILKPLNTKSLGPLTAHGDHLPPMAMVFIMGNHSSGKSSFVNWVIGRDVQTTGLAPTDDGFTVVVPASEDADQDGPAVIGDPHMGFQGLRQFGSKFMNHFQLKYRSNLKLDNVMIVDSPGMVDRAVSGDRDTAYMDPSQYGKPTERGYNFPSVVRWFAERADVVIVAFDPQKPGTTGETLACMDYALTGMERKVDIVFNKADQFTSVNDFARAYGALCWNLSKVMARKDLPPIHTMCIPVKDAGQTEKHSLKDALVDLVETRQRIVKRVREAPLQRQDNLITLLDDNSRMLSMHLRLMKALKERYNKEKWMWYALSGVTLTSLGGLGVGALMYGVWEIALPLLGAGVVGAGGIGWYGKRALNLKALELQEDRELDNIWRKLYHMGLAEKDASIVSIWERVRPQLQNAIKTLGFDSLPSIRSSEIDSVDHIHSKIVVDLRKSATKARILLQQQQEVDYSEPTESEAEEGEGERHSKTS